MRGLVEFDGLLDQILIGDRLAACELCLAPAIQQVACARRSLEPRLELCRLTLDECFGLFVAGVVDDRQVKTQSFVDISNTRLCETSLGKSFRFSRADEVLEGLFKFVFARSSAAYQ